MQVIRPLDGVTIYQGHVLDGLALIPDESVRCIVTSDPYWGLRDYGTATWVGGDPQCKHDAPAWAGDPGDLERIGAGAVLNANQTKWAQRTGGICPKCGARRINTMDVDWPEVSYSPMSGLPAITVPAWRGAYGLEPTPEMYVAHSVLIRRELRRVLRDDGVMWLNLGDSYSGSGVNDGTKSPGLSKAALRGNPVERPTSTKRWSCPLKPKDMIGIPWRVAFALQADGWYLRSDVIWSKPNPMPESVTDRPTKAHEYVFLLAKSERYFYDADAIREPHAEVSIQRAQPHRTPAGKAERSGQVLRPGQQPNTLDLAHALHPAGRNKRSVWTIATQPFPEAHFATFPEELPRTCILAGTSPQACPKCGAPWERVVVKESHSVPPAERKGRVGHNGAPPQQSGWFWKAPTVTSEGWQPTCSCEGNDGSAKCKVLDPFGGSMTTVQVSLELGREAIACELNPAYIDIGLRSRIRGAQTTLLGMV